MYKVLQVYRRSWLHKFCYNLFSALSVLSSKLREFQVLVWFLVAQTRIRSRVPTRKQGRNRREKLKDIGETIRIQNVLQTPKNDFLS